MRETEKQRRRRELLMFIDDAEHKLERETAKAEPRQHIVLRLQAQIRTAREILLEEVG